MRTLARLSVLCVALAAFGCSSSESGEGGPVPPPTAATPAETPTETPADTEPFELFGDPLDHSIAPTKYEDILASPDAYKNKQVLTNGVVRANCQERGCWMEIRPEADRNGAGATVKFKDYSFFVPLDSRGARVMFQGIVKVSILTPAQVKELEREGMTVTNKLPDGSAKMILIMASGVEMRGRKSTSK